MFWKRWSLAQRVVVGGALLYNFLLLWLMIVQPGSRHFFETASNWLQGGPALLATVCAFACARRPGLSRFDRQGWALLGASNLSWTIGEYVWAAYELRGVEAPLPSWGDAFWLVEYPLLFAGILRLFGAIPVAGRTRLLLDSAIAASSAGTLAWHFLVERLWQASDVSLLGKIVSCAYPLGDIGSLFCALVLVSASAARPALRRATISLAAGIICIAVADSLFSQYNLSESYHTGVWFDYLWPLGGTLMSFSALLALWGREASLTDAVSVCPFPDAPVLVRCSPLRLLRVLLPYLAASFAFALVAVADFKTDGRVSTSVFLQGLGLIGLVIARQVFTLMENQNLTAQLQNFNDTLEEKIAGRTAQLNALQQLTTAVNTTLDVAQVVDEAVAHIGQVLRSEAVILCLTDETTRYGGVYPPIRRQTGLDERPDLLQWISRLPRCESPELVPLPARDPDDPPTVYLRAPLLWHHKPLGMVGVVRRGASFDAGEIALIGSIGLEVGTALEHARRYAAAVEAADRDAVTGLLNHRALQQRLDLAWAAAQESGSPLTLVMMDVNNFKLFNDTYGHPVGDQVLREVGAVLKAEWGEDGVLGRYGGDEFLAILPGQTPEDAIARAQCLRARMQETGYQTAGDERTIPITLSFGFAAFPADSLRRHELLSLADTNLYAARLSERGIAATTEQQRANRNLRVDSSFDVLDALVTAVDNKDSYTRRHSEDVTEYALWIAEELGLSEETMRVIRISGLLHDVGKIGVPGEILHKPARLTPEEYEVLKRHPHLGSLIVSALPDMKGIVDAVRFHHERWDGQGYPDALAGEEIPFLGRLLAVADAVSAMTTDRPYRRGLDWETVLREVQTHSGTQFDPRLAQAFLAAARRRAQPKLPKAA